MKQIVKRNEIQMRDPFVYVEGDVYYLYGTTDSNCWRGPFEGFKAYKSLDLENFEDMGFVFTPPPGFWAEENFWAPEMHYYQNNYYLFASFKSPGRRRATSILKAESPLGPFAPFGDEAVTPDGWECLDGTFYEDEAGKPWCIFCHEWVQLGGGTICAVRLKDDLSGAQGQPIILFRAEDAAWTKQITHSSGMKGHVTDGPFMLKPTSGGLWMLWSSVTETGYGIGLAVSKGGHIKGPWHLPDEPIYARNGGHGMAFTAKDGQAFLTIHAPNDTPNERPIFLPVKETENGLELVMGGVYK